MDDAEATVTQDIFAFDEDGIQAARQALSRDELLARVTALMQSCEGCETVGVVGVTPLDRPDSAGCNWSYTLELEAAGVPPEVYGLAYAQVIALARSSWNLR
ncbi:MAG TPA: hypothetical protein VFB93_13690 [Burkholderiales bacterium]|nr:hypothetical protein [Burkholderiales bacterium]